VSAAAQLVVLLFGGLLCGTIGFVLGLLLMTPKRVQFEEAKEILMRAHGCKNWNEVREIYKK
jgi:hypothetical protein